MSRSGRILGALLGALLGCGSSQPDAVRMPASGTMMAGDSMAMMATPLIPETLARLDSLELADSTARAIAFSHHAALLSPLLKAIETDLMHMGMHRDPAYEALVDSVRADAAALVPGPRDALRGQVDRVRRMLSGYGAMVGKGKRG